MYSDTASFPNKGTTESAMRKLLSGFARRLPSRFEREAATGTGSARQRWHWPLRLETRFVISAALSVVFYFIASNTGCGWVYLLSASLLAALLLGVLAPAVDVRLVEASVSAPSKLVAGQKLNAMLTLTRRAGWVSILPVQWLRLSYELDGCEKSNGADSIQPILVESLS